MSGHPHARRRRSPPSWRARRWATLVPHVYPPSEPGFPPYSIGARLPRTPLGRALWRRARPDRARGHRAGPRRAERDAPAASGCRRSTTCTAASRASSRWSATFPQLEYPRTSSWPWVHVTGPLMWERPADDVELPPGDDPLVLVAPSTSQDREQRMLRAALARAGGRAGAGARDDEPARRAVGDLAVPRERARGRLALLRAHDAALRGRSSATPATARVVRALASGVPVVACPAAGDMAENAARVAVGGRGRLAAPPARDGARDQAGGAAGAGRAALRGTGARAGGLGREQRRSGASRRTSWRKSSGGGTRTHNPSINSRMLCH